METVQGVPSVSWQKGKCPKCPGHGETQAGGLRNKAIYLNRHVSNLVVIVAADDQEQQSHEEGGVAGHDHEEALGEFGPS